MRFLAVVCVFFIAINYLGSIGGVDGNNIHFSLNGGTSATYSNFLEALRAKLTQGTQPKHGVRVLNQREPKSGRFILVDLSNYNDRTITVAMDVLNVYVVGYRVEKPGKACFYYLDDKNYIEPIKKLFTDIKDIKDRIKLEFTGSYPALESAAGQRREKIPLGASPLDSAIGKLYYDERKSVAKSLIVIIQMVSEAARFGFIQSQIVLVFPADYTPGLKTLSLENKWSDLSKAIQGAPANGQFKNPVLITDINNKPLSITNVKSAIKETDIKLLLSAPMISTTRMISTM